MRVIEYGSPNHDERPPGARIDMLVLHYTGMKTADEALARLCDARAKVSAHYTVDRDGRIYRHVPEELRAWHAGASWWDGERNVNGRSIGIELVNPGHEFGYVPFAGPQIAALIDLAGDIVSRRRIAPARVLAHSDVAPARKEDPGELFPWAQLAEFGIGLWPFSQGAAPTVAHFMRATPPVNGGGKVGHFPQAGEAAELAQLQSDVEAAFLRGLREFGYGTPPDVEVTREKLVAAFQRHWRPARVDGVVDDESADRLDVLLGSLS